MLSEWQIKLYQSFVFAKKAIKDIKVGHRRYDYFVSQVDVGKNIRLIPSIWT